MKSAPICTGSGDDALLRSPVLLYGLGPVVLSLQELQFRLKCLHGIRAIYFCVRSPSTSVASIIAEKWLESDAVV